MWTVQACTHVCRVCVPSNYMRPHVGIKSVTIGRVQDYSVRAQSGLGAPGHVFARIVSTHARYMCTRRACRRRVPTFPVNTARIEIISKNKIPLKALLAGAPV